MFNSRELNDNKWSIVTGYKERKFYRIPLKTVLLWDIHNFRFLNGHIRPKQSKL